MAAKPPKEIPQGEGGGGSARFENDDGWVTGGGGSKPKNRQIISDVIFGRPLTILIDFAHYDKFLQSQLVLKCTPSTLDMFCNRYQLTLLIQFDLN